MWITILCIKDTSSFPEKPQRCHQLPFLFGFVTQAYNKIALKLLGFRCSMTEQEQGKAPEWPVSKITCKHFQSILGTWQHMSTIVLTQQTALTRNRTIPSLIDSLVEIERHPDHDSCTLRHSPGIKWMWPRNTLSPLLLMPTAVQYDST